MKKTIMISTQNPYTGTLLKEYSTLNDEELQIQLEFASQAFLSWRETSLEQRKHCINSLIRQLMDKKTEAGKTMALEMGKPIKFGVVEIEKCISVCEFYLAHASEFLAPTQVSTEFYRSYITYQPLGVILAVMPWNFPFWQVFRFMIPNLLLGNTVVLKHASNVTGCGQLLERLIHQSGFPEFVFKHLLITSSQVEAVIAHPCIRGVTLTGGEAAGREIASIAGRHLKKQVLELGGNDPFIILKDANLEQAAKAIAQSRMRNSGQVCVAAKRIIVEKEVEKPLIQLLLKELTTFVMGDPLNFECNYGPMAREDLRTHLHQQVQAMIAEGATLVCGGYIPEMQGYFYPPTVLSNVSSNSIGFTEEVFGPVVSITTAQNQQEALDFANMSQFGLGACIFTNELEHSMQMAERIESGVCFVNLPVTSDIRFPFGGVKNSGYGRELSREGMLEFANIKTVIINEIE